MRNRCNVTRLSSARNNHLFKPQLFPEKEEFIPISIWFRKYSKLPNQILKAHTCNPSYLGVFDQEKQSSRPAQAKSLRNPISTNSLA
jgi:hypothetical protein